MIPRRVSTSVVLLALVACRDKATIALDAAPAATPSAVAVVDADADAPVRAFVQRWNDALSKHDDHTLETLYAAHVLYYGANLTPAECAKKQRGLFASAPDFTQSAHDVVVETTPNGGGARLARFTKTATAHGKTHDYPSYLVIGSDLRIIEESDSITDANLEKMAKQIVPAVAAATRCEEAIGNLGAWLEKKYPLTCPTMVEEYDDASHRSCAAVHCMMSDHAPRMYSWCVDFTSGDVFATGGWLMFDAVEKEQRLDVPAQIHADVARLCKQP